MPAFRFCPCCQAPLIEQNIDQRLRLQCEAKCGYVHWNNPTPVVAGLVKHQDQYLLAQNQAWPNNMYSLITGFLEAQERPETAIIRETQEELGLVVADLSFLGHFSLVEHNQLILAYAIEATGELQLGEEIRATLALSSQQLLEYDFGPLKLTQDIVASYFMNCSQNLRHASHATK